MSRFISRARIAVAALIMAVGPTLAGSPGASATTSNYGEFSRIFERAAGQYWSGGAVSGQWAWEPQSSTVSRIRWGDPATWPPSNYERFEKSGGWLLLEGYGDDTGLFAPQIVTSEQAGDVNCQNMAPLPGAGGKQHYVQWDIPNTAYCLEAWGYIDYQGTHIDFYHKQVWFPPSPATCNNTYFTGRICVKQYEIWQDNNGDPGGQLVQRHHRDHILAKGLGPAFIVHDWATGWEAHGRFYWTY